ncbi:hypothetical protein D3C78_1849970 [compost metagenome]
MGLAFGGRGGGLGELRRRILHQGGVNPANGESLPNIPFGGPLYPDLKPILREREDCAIVASYLNNRRMSFKC